MRSTNKQGNEKVSDAQSHKRKYEGAHVTVGSYLQPTVSNGPFEEVIFDGASGYARIQEKNIPGQGRCAKKLAWPEVVRNASGQGRAGSGKAEVEKRAKLEL